MRWIVVDGRTGVVGRTGWSWIVGRTGVVERTGVVDLTIHRWLRVVSHY